MNSKGYREFLESEVLPNGKRYSKNGVSSRISRARRIEKELKIDLDEIVKDVELTRYARKLIYSYFQKGADDLFNALTRYYKFKNGNELLQT